MANTFALMAVLAASIGLANGTLKEKSTPKRAPSDATSSMVIFDYDFNNYEGTSAYDLMYEMRGFFSFQEASASPSIEEKNGRKGLEYTINAKDSEGRTALGSFGADSGYFSKLISGQKYRVSFYASFETSAADPVFTQDYKIEDTSPGSGIEVHKDGAKRLSQTHTFNTSYNKKVVSFEFVPSGDTAHSYMELSAKDFTLGDKIFLDDLKIEAVDNIFGTHFNDDEVGSHGDAIENVSTQNANDATIKKDADGVKYMEFAKDSVGNHVANDNLLCVSGDGNTLAEGHKYRYTLNFVNKASIASFVIAYPNGHMPGIHSTQVSFPSETTSFAEGSVFSYISLSANKLVVELSPHYVTLDLIAIYVNYDEHALIDVYSIEIEDLGGGVSSSIAYAKDFLAVTVVCDATGATNNITNEIWSSLQAKYEALSTVAKETVKKANPNVSGNDLEKAAARYDYIASKYRDTLANYMGRTLTNITSPSGIIPMETNNILDITLVLLMSLVSVLGIVIIKHRHRKSL